MDLIKKNIQWTLMIRDGVNKWSKVAPKKPRVKNKWNSTISISWFGRWQVNFNDDLIVFELVLLKNKI